MNRCLDTRKPAPYIRAPLWVLVGVLGLSLEARGEKIDGVLFPDGIQKVGENRYRAPGDFDETKKYYKTVYPPAQYPRKDIVNQPGVKAVHIVNPSGKIFEGLNIYEANDEVRIFVVPAELKAPEKKKGAAKPPKK